MATTVAQLANTLQTLFTDTAERVAHETGFIRRHRKLSGAGFARTLVFTWLDNPQATLDDLASATALHGEPLTPQALQERFTPQAADYLQRLLGEAVRHVLTAHLSYAGLLRRFTGVYLRDGTSIALPATLASLWPGCGGRGHDEACQAVLKVQVQYELRAGGLHELTLHPGRHPDNRVEQQAPPLPAGSLRLADLGFFDLSTLQTLDQQRVYFISRVQAGTTVYDTNGRKWKLAAFLASRRADRVDQWVQMGVKERLVCRLLAIRTPAAVAAARRQRAAQQAQDHGHTVSAQKLELCGWTVFLSNAPRWLLCLQEAWVLYRLRWQVELLFKLWKSQGGVDSSRSGKAYQVLCEVFAKRLAMVVQHWLLLTAGVGFSDRSRWKAARLVRRQAMQVASVRGQPRALRRVLRLLQRLLGHSGRVNRRRRRPSAYQTMLDPDHDGLT